VDVVSQRALEVLRVIVEDYVDSREPVGSKTIVERHSFGVSAATIRNDMAALEEANLIHAPHTSAGRVPTDLGYRRFVDSLTEVRPLTSTQISAIHRFLDESLDLNDFFGRTVKLLSNLTNQVAMVQYPTLTRDAVAHVELLPLSARRALSILITTSGSADRSVVEFESDVDETELGELRTVVNSKLHGVMLTDVDSTLAEVARTSTVPAAALINRIRVALVDQIDAQRHERLIVAGTPQLIRSEGDFSRSLAPVMDAIEEQVVLLTLFDEMRQSDASNVRIGRELSDDLSDTSIVSAAYTSSGGDTARLAVLGPTRMNYPLNMAAVEAVARYVSQVLGDDS
jgi:heat-inducible transcriptional repressor